MVLTVGIIGAIVLALPEDSDSKLGGAAAPFRSAIHAVPMR